jgi:hypothetical protein
MAKRVKKVDFAVMDEIRRLWPTVVGPTLSQVCQPEFMKNRVLTVRVPSGAYAQQILLDQETILRGFAVLDDHAPLSLKTVQKA